MKLPQPLLIRCPEPSCRYRWMRARAGILKPNGELLRKYFCPACGEVELISRRVGNNLPRFVPPKEE